MAWLEQLFLQIGLNMSTSDILWISIGLGGQLCFSMRFLYQWWKSETVKKSVIPVAFWYFSCLGGLILLAYAIRQQDPVIIIGQACGLLIYSRNLYLIWAENSRHRQNQKEMIVP